MGRRDEELLRAAGEMGVDLLALGCSQELAAGHAPVVHAALERGHVPVLLVPVPVRGAAVVQPVEKEVEEKSWSSSQLSRV